MRQAPSAATTNAANSHNSSKGRLQRGAGLGLAAIAIGLLTAFSGVVIEMASHLLADMRYGVCVERIPGDTRPLWHVTLSGSWRPYDRARCCGGSPLVDHATGECRATSIIKHTTNKRFAYPVHSSERFGHMVTSLLQWQKPVTALSQWDKHDGASVILGDQRSNLNEAIGEMEQTSMESKAAREDETIGEMDRVKRMVQSSMEGVHAESRRSKMAQISKFRAAAAEANYEEGSRQSRNRMHAKASTLARVADADGAMIRSHHSANAWSHDSSETWAEETAPHAALAERNVELAVNDDVIQTQSESAGSLAPYYEWVPWERALRVSGRSPAVVIYVLGSSLFALLAGLVTRLRPASKGSGIPEVKASAAGFSLPRSFRLQTLMAKVVGLTFCVGAGLAVGKEGPMIHIGACWGTLLAVPLTRLARGASVDTELVCVGAAAGVAAAFGAPLAGVLFAIEELGTSMATGLKYSTMLLAFGSAMVADLALKWVDLSGNHRLTLFEVDYKQVWAPWEAIPFCLLGALGGVVGGIFVILNESIHKRRLRAERSGRLAWCLPKSVDASIQRIFRLPQGCDYRVLEVLMLAVFTALSNYPCLLTRMLQNDAIAALFSQCPTTSPSTTTMHHVAHDPIGLCHSSGTWGGMELVQLLFGAAALRFLQTSVTFGALVPAGLFVPSLYVGGCLGRAVGSILRVAGPLSMGVPVEPGIYAMIGAGAVLAGVSRLTLSLAVVLFELTGGLTYVVPFMLSVIIAKGVGDLMTDGRSIYDVYAALNGFAKVEEPEDLRLLSATLQDLRDGDLETVGQSACSGPDPALWVSSGHALASELAEHCRAVKAAGFPVLSLEPGGEPELLGWASSTRLLALLDAVPQDRWCRVAGRLAAPAPGPFAAQPPPGPVEDVTAAIETGGCVRVRVDCPVLTALCAFRERQEASAMVSVSGPPYTAQTTSRELFFAQLVHGRLHALPSSSLLAAAGFATSEDLVAKKLTGHC